MSIEHISAIPRLVVLAATPARHPRSFDLPGGDVLVGRGQDCQLVLDDPHVSRNHAVIRHRGGQVHVEDLASSGGTKVNGALIGEATPLRDGDVITFATVDVRYEAGTSLADTQLSHPRPAPGDVRYDIGSQHGHVVSNVGRDQYNAYVQQVRQERESFLREIARTKSKARVLAWLGFLLTVVGFLLYGWVIVRFIERVPTLGPNSSPELLGPDVAGIPVGVLGLAAMLVGSVLLTVGLVLHIVAAARKRRTDRDLPLPPPPTY